MRTAVAIAGALDYAHALRGPVEGEAQRRPSFLPDQRHVLFWDWKAGKGLVSIGDIVTGTKEQLHDNVYEPAYVAPGILAFTRPRAAGGVEPLFIQPFDLGRRQLTGTPVMISDLLDRANNWREWTFSNNVLIYANRDTLTNRFAVVNWWSRSDKRFTPVSLDGNLRSFRISHDGRRVAFGGFGLWVTDVARNVAVRVPTKLTVSLDPVWSPGDSVLAYGDGDTRLMSLTSPGEEQIISLEPASGNLVAQDWSPDGRTILFLQFPSDSSPTFELWGYSTTERRSERVLANTSSVFDARFSPDGHWIAYESDASGSHEIYLIRFPQSGAAIRVSAAGGGSPRWRADGHELYFIARDGRVMVSNVQLAAVPTVASPTVLTGEPVTPEPFQGDGTHFDAAPLGDRFIIRRESFAPPVIGIITGWQGLIKPEANRP